MTPVNNFTIKAREVLKNITLGIFVLICFLGFFPWRALASGPSIVSGTIGTSTVWTLADSPFVVQHTLFVASGAALTIEPGVIVKFYSMDSGLSVLGTLNAHGVSSQKIYFTSFKDDLAGGDTNNDGLSASPAPGDWDRISILGGGNADISNSVIRFGGTNEWPELTVHLSGGTLSLSQSHVSQGMRANIMVQGGTTNITSSEIDNAATTSHTPQSGNGIVHTGGTLVISQSSIHDNPYFGIQNFFSVPADARNNWWGDASGPFHPELNPQGQGNAVSDNVDFIPFLGYDPIQSQQPQPPSLSNLQQYKSDGASLINESGITTEDIVVFKARLDSPSNNQVKLEVELREFNQPFTGIDDGGIIRSGFVTSGSTAAITRFGLVNGVYKWRARAVDTNSNTSDWQEFGIAGNIDFEIKLVPLYTQVVSDFPDATSTKGWAGRDYADLTATSSCGKFIADCGCAITSMVMLGRYYGIGATINNTSVDPANINRWLNNNNGYDSGENLYWGKSVEYLGFISTTTGKKMVRFDFNEGTDWNIPATSTRINNFLDSGKPIVAKSKRFGHYFIIDGKLADTLTLKDPKWYNTKKLNETENLANQVRGYNNFYNSANLFTFLQTPKKLVSSLHIAIASPAEILVTDPLGRRTGNDPVANVSYNEIPDAVYGQEDAVVSSEIPLDPSQIHIFKQIHVQTPIEGQYTVEIIGTGAGTYVLDILAVDENGGSNSATTKGITAVNNIQTFELNFSSSAVAQTMLYRNISIIIKPDGNQNSINLKSKGVTPVAVLSDEFFDAKNVIIDSVLFAGAKSKKGHIEDVNNDGSPDLMLQFNTQSLNLAPTSTKAVLTGRLRDGSLIKGADTVKVLNIPEKYSVVSRLSSLFAAAYYGVVNLRK